MGSRAALRSLVILALLSAPAAAQARGPLQRFDPAQDVGMDQRLGESIPLELRFSDDEGRRLSLRELFDERPVVLVFVYYECPMLCNLVLNGALDTLREVQLEPGDDYLFVALSIDPREGPELAARKKAGHLERFATEREPPNPDGLRFLTGDEASIRRLASAAGFRYVYDEEADEFAHAGGLIVLTPEGELSRYFYGVEFLPRDLRLALVESSQGRIGTLADQFLMLCLHYDPTTGRYGATIFTALRLAGLATVLVLVTYMLVMLRRERRLRPSVGLGGS